MGAEVLDRGTGTLRPGRSTEQLALSVDERGTLAGSSADPRFPEEVRVAYNGRHLATVPSFAEGTGRRFSCDLPVLAEPEDAEIVVLDEVAGVLGRTALRCRQPLMSGHGIMASDILALHGRPFFGVPYISFDGAQIAIVGSHLPPGGDPGSLGVAFGPGVAYDFRYPLESPGWDSHFWYWPNARLSDFQLVIDLAASEAGSDPFSFRFTYPDLEGGPFGEPYGHVWALRDLAACVGFPNDITQLTRVQTWSDNRSVTMTGYNAFRAIEAMLHRYGVGSEGTRLMDWGCGHGRVARHFAREWPQAKLIGMDIDAENIAWSRKNIRPAQFVASPLVPPCELEDGCLDALFSISVMTHLTADVQRRWLAELARLIRPGGIALMSFGGPAAVAWSSIWHKPEYIEKWRRDGIHDDKIDHALAGKIAEADYYRVTAQTHEHVRANWQEHFEILDILPEAIGNLDFAILRRR